VTIQQFEQHIADLDQTEILSGAISALNKLLVDKKILREQELQDYFLEWMRDHKKLAQKRAIALRRSKRRKQ
jgi:hypothetical protein